MLSAIKAVKVIRVMKFVDIAISFPGKGNKVMKGGDASIIIEVVRLEALLPPPGINFLPRSDPVNELKASDDLQSLPA
jgi:hypothetical protein